MHSQINRNFDSGYGINNTPKHQRKASDMIISILEIMQDSIWNRSFKVVYQYTLDAVKFLFNQGCSFVIVTVTPLQRKR